MSLRATLTLVGLVACIVGAVCLLAPGWLIGTVKSAEVTGPAITMARTVGVLLTSVGILNLMVRSHPPGRTLHAVMVANLVLQVSILPIDVGAWLVGTYETLGSWVPNTLLHVGLILLLSRHLTGSRDGDRR